MPYRNEGSKSYLEMVGETYEIPLLWSIWSPIGTWLLLAGYLLQRSQAIHDSGQIRRLSLSASYSIHVLVVASVLCGIATILLYLVWS